MKTQPKNIFRYFADQFFGSFTGFIIGLWASRLVSHFFATRSIKNLWGLTAKKTLVDKQTFGMLEWLASVVVGYLVFEVVVRFVKNYVAPRLPMLRQRLSHLAGRSVWSERLKEFTRGDDSIVREMP